MNIIEYVEKLEKLLGDEEKLRDEMRQNSARKDALIRLQSGNLKNIAHLNDLLRERRNRAARKLNIARNETRSMEARLKKMQKRLSEQDEFVSFIKAVAKEAGIWPLIKTRLAERKNISE